MDQIQGELTAGARGARISMWGLGGILAVAVALFFLSRSVPGFIGSGGTRDTITVEEKSRILSSLSTDTASSSSSNTDAKLRVLQNPQQESNPPASTNNSSATQEGSAGASADTGPSEAEKLRILQ